MPSHGWRECPVTHDEADKDIMNLYEDAAQLEMEPVDLMYVEDYWRDILGGLEKLEKKYAIDPR